MVEGAMAGAKAWGGADCLRHISARPGNRRWQGKALGKARGNGTCQGTSRAMGMARGDPGAFEHMLPISVHQHVAHHVARSRAGRAGARDTLATGPCRWRICPKPAAAPGIRGKC